MRLRLVTTLQMALVLTLVWLAVLGMVLADVVRAWCPWLPTWDWYVRTWTRVVRQAP